MCTRRGSPRGQKACFDPKSTVASTSRLQLVHISLFTKVIDYHAQLRDVHDTLCKYRNYRCLMWTKHKTSTKYHIPSYIDGTCCYSQPSRQGKYGIEMQAGLLFFLIICTHQRMQRSDVNKNPTLLGSI